MNWSRISVCHWHDSLGLREGEPKYSEIVPGMVLRLHSGNWRMRVGSRGSGYTWKQVPETHPVVKRVRTLALLLDIKV